MSGRRFLWLDGSRGVAAIMVMIYHFDAYLQTGKMFKSSFLAVDLFFMMSGFVLAHAYGKKMLTGMTFAAFLRIRLIRLYPLYAAATMMGLGYYLMKIVLGMNDAPTIGSLVSISILNSLFLPNLDSGLIPTGMFPFAPTSWSLSIEMILSLMFAGVFYKQRPKTLVLIVLASAACFVLFSIYYNTADLGWESRTFPPSLFRAVSEFSLGLLIYQIVKTANIEHASHLIAIATFVVLISLMVLAPPTLSISLISITVVFPLIIFFQASSEPRPWLAGLCHQLGRGSYPIYLLHTPVLLWGVGFIKKVALPAYISDNGSLIGISLIGTTLVLSYLLLLLLDEPIRAYLRKRTALFW